MEVPEDPHPRRTTYGLVTQVFEQRLAVNQLESCLLQHGELVAQAPGVRPPPHQPRMLTLPSLPRAEVIEDATGDSALIRLRTAPRDLNAIGGFAHQLRVADPAMKHGFALLARLLLGICSTADRYHQRMNPPCQCSPTAEA